MAEQVHRKLATIFAADVVGYSRLTGADEEGTLKTLKTYREILDRLIARHEGRIFGTAGDSVIAEFGSAVEAVRCAVVIQEELKVHNAELSENRRMLFRIGINVGDVMIDGANLFGDGVNVAARLEAAAEPGGICISSSVFEQVRNKLTVGFEKIGPLKLKNIAQPVPAFRLVSGPVSKFAAGTAFLARRLRMPTLAAVVVVIAVVVGGIVWWQPWAPTAEAHRLSIVVLPFDNLSSDPKQDYLADGITEDLITDLSRIRGAFVIARGTSFTYKGKAVNAKDVAQELNVHYVLEGSVEREGDQVRVNVQLINGKSGAAIWSERFDRKFKDVFSLQNDVTGRIAGVLNGELLAAESRELRRGRPENLDAWEIALQGYVKASKMPRTVDQYREVKALLDKALAADPKLVMGWVGLARLHYVASTRGYPGISHQVAKKMLLATSQRAVALDPKDADAQTELGLAYRLHHQPDKGKASCETALELNPNYDDAYVCVGLTDIALGKPDAAIPLFEKALELNPRHTTFREQLFIGLARILMGQPDKAVAALKKGLADFPTMGALNWALVSALGSGGHEAEAQKALSNYLQMKDASNLNTIESVRARFAYFTPNVDKLLEGLRRAGMPEK